MRSYTNPGRWSDEELAILRKHYPEGGVKACIELLPLRQRESISQKAYSIGVAMKPKVECETELSMRAREITEEHAAKLAEQRIRSELSAIELKRYELSALYKQKRGIDSLISIANRQLAQMLTECNRHSGVMRRVS